MDKAEFMKRYWYYYETLMKLARFPVDEKITVRKLKPTRGVEQALYKDREKWGLEDVDFILLLCQISWRFLMYKWEESEDSTESGLISVLEKNIYDARNAFRGRYFFIGREEENEVITPIYGIAAIEENPRENYLVHITRGPSVGKSVNFRQYIRDLEAEILAINDEECQEVKS